MLLAASQDSESGLMLYYRVVLELVCLLSDGGAMVELERVTDGFL